MLLFLFLRYKFLNCKDNLHNYLPTLTSNDSLSSSAGGAISWQLNNTSYSHNYRYNRDGSNNHGNNEDDCGNDLECDDSMDVTMLNSRQMRSRRRRQHVERPCSCLIPLIRFWGIITAIGEWAHMWKAFIVCRSQSLALSHFITERVFMSFCFHQLCWTISFDL